MIKFTRDQNFIALFYIICAIFISAISIGINVVAFPAMLIKNDVTPFFVGFATTIEIIANILISIYLSKIVGRIGVSKALCFFGALFASNILLIYFYQNFLIWLCFCAMNGACWFSIFILRQSWINHLANGNNRSVILALITTFFCTGFAIGSFLIKHLGATNYHSFIISSILIIIATLLILPVKSTQPKEIDSARIGIIKFFKHLPNPTIARLMLEIQCGCILFLTVVFGSKIGLSAEKSGLLISAFMASGFCDLYAGFLVKKYDRYNMIKYGFSGCLLSIIIVAIFHDNFNIMFTAFFTFGCSVAMAYIALITIVSESFNKEKLIAANTTFQSFAAIGALLGSFIGGALINLFGFLGFFITIILANLTYFVFIFFYEKKGA